MSKDLVQEQIQKNPGLVIDTSEIQATCLFCPYAVDKSISWFVLSISIYMNSIFYLFKKEFTSIS
jgi:hypothetical protein